jgi:membrane carboxypeptidase/penicillin-binding protein
MIDLAKFYAAIANEGAQVTPYSIESIESRGHVVYKHQAPPPHILADGDRASFFQLRTMLEGVVARSTAASMKQLAHFVGGKTGTTENESDAWFVGFTNDVTVAVWVGYDNARGRRTLGSGQTGGRVAVPIVEPIIEASWALQAPKVPLPPPSAEATRHLKALPIDYNSGQRLTSTRAGAFTEYFKLDGHKKLRDTQYALTSRHAVARSEPRLAPEAREIVDERPAAPPIVGGRLPPSDRVPRSLRELFGF